jgi:adenylosuccinate synthase
MTAIAVVGAQWGDEGKGKIVDMLAEKANLVVRFSGGDNAGHTVINQLGEFKLHLIPSGIFYPHTTCIIGNGVAVNPGVLLKEMRELQQRQVDTSRLFISDRAHLIMPYHILLDGLDEDAAGGKAIGTTRKGVGPAFTDKAARLGIRAGDLVDKNSFLPRLRTILEKKNLLLTRIYGIKALSLEEIYSQYCAYGEKLAPYICDTTVILESALKKNQRVLLEGAQGVMLDPDFGTYPYVTSSSPMVGGSSLGAGISPLQIDRVLAVFKAYCTRVGGGPLPTELDDEIGEAIRQKAHEFGTTTGRARRCGWFDSVEARYSTRLNGYTGSAITRLDVLDDFPKVKICVAYKLGAKVINDFPARLAELEKCTPVYEELDGWMTPITEIRSFDQLPAAARHYVSRLETLSNCPVNLVSEIGRAHV